MIRRITVITMVGVALSAWGAAGAVALCDYTAPRTSLTSLWLSGSYRYFEDPATPGVDVNAGRIGLNLNRFLDSPSYGYTTTVLGEVGVVNLAPVSVSLQATTSQRYYFTPGQPLFGFGGVAATYATGQPQLGLTVSAGAGYGRFTNVTPLAKALRIQEILLERKVLTQALADDTILAVAQEIGRRAEYAEVKDLAAAVVRIIETAAGVQLDPRSVLAVEDLILATGDERYCGWAVQGGLGYEVLDPYGGERSLVLTLSGEAALAPAPGAQLRLSALATGPFDIANEHALTATLTYEQALSPTATFQGSAAFGRVKPAGQEPKDTLAASAQLAFTWGKAQIGIGLALTKGPAAPGWSVDVSLSLAMKVL